MVTTTLTATAKSVRDGARSISNSLWKYYFTNRGYGESPLIVASVTGLFGFGFLGFLTMAFNTVATTFGILAITSFVGCVALHFTLWVTGAIYQHGIIKCAENLAFAITAICVVGIVGGFLLYGWFIPLTAAAAWYSTTVPSPFNEIFAPIFTICMITIALAWCWKGMSYLDV